MNFLSLTDMCSKASVMAVILFIKELLKILFIIVPIGLILILSIDMAKNVIGNEEEMKKNVNVFVKRIIFTVILFFIPTIMTITTDLLEDAGVFNLWGDKTETNWKECLDYSTFDNLKDLQELEKIKDELEKKEKEQEYEEAQKRNKGNDSGNNSSNNKSNNNNSSKNKETTPPPLSGDLIKVLLIGNSYTYYNGYGEMLMKMAKSTGKKIIVVRATKPYLGGRELASETINYKCWSSDNSCKKQKGNAKLSAIINIDFGNKRRKGSWDYIVLQNNESNPGAVYNGDNQIFIKIKGTLKSNKNFILNATYYGKYDTSTVKRYKQHLKFAKRKGTSVMYSYKIFSLYSSNWQTLLQLGDENNHQSGQGAYMYATILYSKIYGTSELASTESSSNFIKVYNNNGTTQKISNDYYKPYNYKHTKKSMTVTDKTARKIQAHVKSRYSKYVNNY